MAPSLSQHSHDRRCYVLASGAQSLQVVADYEQHQDGNNKPDGIFKMPPIGPASNGQRTSLYAQQFLTFLQQNQARKSYQRPSGDLSTMLI